MPPPPLSLLRTMLNGKIHRATVTAADLNYIGSITIDKVLLEAANINAFERVLVVDVTNGNRLETYAIPGETNSGIVQLNGAAAHLINVGDLVIVMSFVQVEDSASASWNPHVVLVDHKNRITDVHGTRRGGTGISE